jgi:biopolymer transport protein ExbB/TolQ
MPCCFNALSIVNNRIRTPILIGESLMKMNRLFIASFFFGMMILPATSHAFNAIQTFHDGGVCMYPLIGSAIIALAIAFERTITLHRLPTMKVCEKQLADIEKTIDKEGLEGAARLVTKGKGILNYTFARLLTRFDTLLTERRDLAQRREQIAGKKAEAVDPVTQYLTDQQNVNEVREELFITVDDAIRGYVGKFLPGLDTIAGIATLMGLLGTITGMISAFNAIATSGTGDPKIVAAGIAEALITTATGLFIAIPSVVLYRWLANKADKSRGPIELYAISFANTLIALAERAE